MRYHYVKISDSPLMYAETHHCDHPVYNCCTLYKIGQKGLAVIQQRFAYTAKATFWTEIDNDLIDQIYLNPRFKGFFDKRAALPDPITGLYPTVTVRQIMWALRMKPLEREVWETVFDRKLI